MNFHIRTALRNSHATINDRQVNPAFSGRTSSGPLVGKPKPAISAIPATSGTMPLIPQVVDAVKVPVIAAGGIADGRGIAAALALGAAAVQVGAAYLFFPEATVAGPHREALRTALADDRC